MVDQPFTLLPGSGFDLKDYDPGFAGGLRSAGEAKDQKEETLDRLTDLQEMLYAQGQYALPIVLQGLDTSGKDGIIKHIMRVPSPQGVQWYRNLVVSGILVSTLEGTGLRYPDPVQDTGSFVIPD